ncbi:hypothetical protein L3V59_31275 [Burkholderia aenigmatica]|uniref:hypothetical protein n=1 Tax=Burkholderia aenigmatica TaxID=2015348 RepID=UPI001F446161|nr:hypothetical protein [Burkholderia aenigmatica]UKD14158.1 hypothetical protein L3V59_31275 [Burkholderia aenigmatica]
MTMLIILALTAAIVLWLRSRNVRFTTPVRRDRDAKEALMRQVLLDSAEYIGEPVQRLIDTLGETKSQGLDHGVIVYTWRANQLCIEASVRNGVCEYLDKSECSKYD